MINHAKLAGLSLLAAASMATVAHADIITFDAQGLTGPSTASVPAADVTVSSTAGDVTFSNGAILTDATNAPADETSVYFNSSFLQGSTGGTITITFAQPIQNFFLDLYNGQTHTDTFTASDNAGQSTTVDIASNTSGGTALISFPAVGSVVTISTSDPNYDFFIDNIGFDQATPGVPEPAAWTLMLVGFGGLGLSLRGSRRVKLA